ncbi:uncharacterized protein LOC134264577 [Saccostrea cucullata]|uniref:uncharacterized protein LOC134264577 n=1 Tax=Saccostrea cuccullata TaxID=36930 RepID=UPI002ED16F03
MKVICTCLLLSIYHYEVTNCLQICFVCSHVKDFASCQQNVRICSLGEVCFTSETFNNNGFLVYNSGCVSKQICDTINGLDGTVKHTTHAPVMIGNILGKRNLNTCFRCCANDGDMYRPCNMNQCSMQAISLTTIVASTRTLPSKAHTNSPKTTATSPTTTPNSTATTPTSTITMSTSTTTTPTSTTTTPTSTTTTPTSTTTTPTSTTTTPTSTTTTPTSTTTTPTSTTTIPITTSTSSTPTSCYLCNGMPIYICEQFSTPLQCATPDQQFCLNILVNRRDGSRTLDRRCVTEQECRKEWWEKTSDRQECSGYNPSSYTAMEFTCSFCCSGSQCNKNIIPDNLYAPSKI